MNVPTCFGLPLLSLLLAAGPLTAQTAIPLDGEYTSGVVASKLDCSPTDFTLHYEFGTVSFDPAGTFTATRKAKSICIVGSIPDQTYNDSGTYTLDSLGKLILDYDPANPGTDTFEMYLSPDRELAIPGPASFAEAAGLAILCRKQDGASQADLTGNHGFVQILQSIHPTDFTTESSYGTIDFDGAGVASLSIQWHSIDPSGPQSGVDAGLFGPIVVAADGTLSVGGEQLGAICAGGEFGFLMGYDSREFSMALFTRDATGVASNAIDGEWNLHSYGGSSDFGLNHESQSTQAVGSISGSAGSFAFVGTAHIVNRTSVATFPGSPAGTMGVNPDGSFVATVSGGATLQGWFAEELGVGILADVSSFDFAEAGLVLRRCASSFAYGAGTPGAGGVTPVLETNGLPTIGTTNYTFLVDEAVGGSIAILGVAGTPLVSGFPLLGGTLFLDPLNTFLMKTIPLGGSAGVPGTGSGSLAVTIPVGIVLPGWEFYAQAVVIDPAAPAGFSMTQAVAFQACN
ncbi:MAG: hypothetical protein P1V81_11870 [Planctomycetota bacterium]|nr:hypothetical protein [Planctomycetota bacterium]